MRSDLFDHGWRKRMMKQATLTSFAAVIAAFGALSASISTAQQSQQAKSLQFEVAAIRPGNPKLGNQSSSSWGRPGGQFQTVNTPLKEWVKMGLSVRDYALVAPSWLDTSRFDLNAKMPTWKSGEPVVRNPMAEMMKALLIERFGLKWHEEVRTVSGYELVTDKKVLVKPATLLERLRGSVAKGWGPTLINGIDMPMSDFAEMLGDSLGRPVVDATHLSGGYDINLMWHPMDDPAPTEFNRQYWKEKGIDVDGLPDSMSTALREQLGLRLQSAKVPSKVIVVDQINRQPTEN
jgi:uncharacterized protein (TIGR03435 family)